jgi:hypothetical protein
MNAYELAGLIGLCGDGGYNQDAANMLRKQAELIRNLEKSLGFKNSGYETINLTPQLELTDEEILDVSDEFPFIENGTERINFARAILRKAQEKC